MGKVTFIYASNEPESQEKPRYMVSRVVSVIVEEEEHVPEESKESYVAYKAPEVSGSKGGGGTTGDDNAPSERADSSSTEPTAPEHIP